ncbi:hypothetical protein AMTRI_Chr12g239620 [Amborella trichopoda]
MVGESYVDEVGVHGKEPNSNRDAKSRERTDRKSVADEDKTNGKEHNDVDDRSSRERFGHGFVVKENDKDEIRQLKIMVRARFAKKDFKNLKYFLCIEVERTRQVNIITYSYVYIILHKYRSLNFFTYVTQSSSEPCSKVFYTIKALVYKKEKKYVSIHNMSVDDLDTMGSTQCYGPNHSPIGCQLPKLEPPLNVIPCTQFHSELGRLRLAIVTCQVRHPGYNMEGAI